MKTQLRNSSHRILGLIATIAVSINLALFAQPNPDKTGLTLTTADRLEIFATNSEQGLKYVAPDDRTIDMETNLAFTNLELFAGKKGNSLKYSAPVEFEDQIIQEIECLADNMIGQLEYHAPVYDEFTNTFSKPELSALKSNTRPVVADEVTSQEAWLINAGYYRTSGKP